MDAQEQVIGWLRQQPGLWKEAERIALNLGNEFEYGDSELADTLEAWLFSTLWDTYLTKDLGMSMNLRKRMVKSLDPGEFYKITWSQVREVLIEEDPMEIDTSVTISRY